MLFGIFIVKRSNHLPGHFHFVQGDIDIVLLQPLLDLAAGLIGRADNIEDLITRGSPAGSSGICRQIFSLFAFQTVDPKEVFGDLAIQPSDVEVIIDIGLFPFRDRLRSQELVEKGEVGRAAYDER